MLISFKVANVSLSLWKLAAFSRVCRHLDSALFLTPSEIAIGGEGYIQMVQVAR